MADYKNVKRLVVLVDGCELRGAESKQRNLGNFVKFANKWLTCRRRNQSIQH